MHCSTPTLKFSHVSQTCSVTEPPFLATVRVVFLCLFFLSFLSCLMLLSPRKSTVKNIYSNKLWHAVWPGWKNNGCDNRTLTTLIIYSFSTCLHFTLPVGMQDRAIIMHCVHGWSKTWSAKPASDTQFSSEHGQWSIFGFSSSLFCVFPSKKADIQPYWGEVCRQT